MRITALLLLATSVAGFSTVPTPIVIVGPSLPLSESGRTSANPEQVCTCDEETGAAFSCNDVNVDPASLNWCINQCYPFYISSDDHPCVISNVSGLLLACDNFEADQGGSSAQQWSAIIQISTGQTADEYCPGAAEGGCPEVVAGRIQITPIDENGFSTKYCASIELDEGQVCEDFFGYYNWPSDPDSDQFIRPCGTGASGCIGLGAASAQYCGGPPFA